MQGKLMLCTKISLSQVYIWKTPFTVGVKMSY